MIKRLLISLIMVLCLGGVCFGNNTVYVCKEHDGVCDSLSNLCVPSDVAIKAWSDAVGQIDHSSGGMRTMTLECDPCKCPVNGMVDCYEFMATQERSKQTRYKDAVDLLERAKKYGICNNGG